MAINENLYATFQGRKWKKIDIRRRSGVLTPVFSIHSRKSTGTGDFSDLNLLVDFCVRTGNTILQILPLNYAGYDNCPYNAISSFAIDPVYISISDFSYNGRRFSENVIRDLQFEYPAGKNNRCNYKVRDVKIRLLREVFDCMQEDICSDRKFFSFVEMSNYWLDDFSIYQILKEIHCGAGWYEWESSFIERKPEKIERITNTYKKEILFQKWIQYICYSQLRQARQYAKENNVILMGDLPVLVAKDSADVWSKRGFFNLELVAGAPPDMYCAYGQRWGMPVQNRESLRADSFRYVVEKLRYLDNFFDMVRIDHVVGLFRIWAIRADSPIENQGLNGFFIPEDENAWKENGREILLAMIDGCESLLCAEDLGVIPPVCGETLKELGIPGYEIQRWKKNYNTDCSFMEADKYRDLAVSSLSTHDTSFWLHWWKKEAGTVDRQLFYFKCRTSGIDPDKIMPELFDLNDCERLRWKRQIHSQSVLINTIGAEYEKIRDIVQIYRETFDEKEKFAAVSGARSINEIDCLRKSIEFILRTACIFSINLLMDFMCLDSKIAREIGDLRINKPGTTGPHNWTFAFQMPLEEIMESKAILEIRELISDSNR